MQKMFVIWISAIARSYNNNWLIYTYVDTFD